VFCLRSEGRARRLASRAVSRRVAAAARWTGRGTLDGGGGAPGMMGVQRAVNATLTLTEQPRARRDGTRS